MFSRLKAFMSEVKVELKKVTWPSRQDTVASTGVVLVVVFIIGFYLGTIDVLLSRLVAAILG
jgi:preprotein translocase subunit SecE